MPADFAYRKQGSNDNGVLLLALTRTRSSMAATIDGYIEFTSLDNQNVASITVELVEYHKRGGAHGHVVGPLPRAPGPVARRARRRAAVAVHAARAAGHRDDARATCRGRSAATVDINWAVDIDATIPITMRNQDIERLRDALGAMDYRVVDIRLDALGQHFEGTFQPPAHLAKQMGVNEVQMTIEYLGANLKLRMLVDRKGLHHDRALDQVFELGRLRSASQPAEINATIQADADAAASGLARIVHRGRERDQARARQIEAHARKRSESSYLPYGPSENRTFGLEMPAMRRSQPTAW